MPRDEFEKLDVTFHLDEIEAKIYGFLEYNADKAFTLFEIYVEAFVEDWMREHIRETSTEEGFIEVRHPLYTTLQKSAEKMVKEGKIAGKYDQGKYYYAV